MREPSSFPCRGVMAGPGHTPLPKHPAQAARHYETLGAVVEEVGLPSFALGLPAYYVLAVSEASSNLARYDGVRFGGRDQQAVELQVRPWLLARAVTHHAPCC